MKFHLIFGCDYTQFSTFLTNEIWKIINDISNSTLTRTKIKLNHCSGRLMLPTRFKLLLKEFLYIKVRDSNQFWNVLSLLQYSFL